MIRRTDKGGGGYLVIINNNLLNYPQIFSLSVLVCDFFFLRVTRKKTSKFFFFFFILQTRIQCMQPHLLMHSFAFVAPVVCVTVPSLHGVHITSSPPLFGLIYPNLHGEQVLLPSGRSRGSYPAGQLTVDREADYVDI